MGLGESCREIYGKNTYNFKVRITHIHTMKNSKGVAIRGHTICNRSYAVDIALIADNEQAMQNLD